MAKSRNRKTQKKKSSQRKEDFKNLNESLERKKREFLKKFIEEENKRGLFESNINSDSSISQELGFGPLI